MKWKKSLKKFTSLSLDCHFSLFTSGPLIGILSVTSEETDGIVAVVIDGDGVPVVELKNSRE